MDTWSARCHRRRRLIVLCVQLLLLAPLTMRPASEAAAAADRCRTPASTAPRRRCSVPRCAGERRRQPKRRIEGQHGLATVARRSSVPVAWDHRRALAHRSSTPDDRHGLPTCGHTHTRFITECFLLLLFPDLRREGT